MRILITGGAGFIGSHLVEGLAHDGHDIVVLDDFSSGRSENLVGLSVGFELIVGDLCDRDTVRKAIAGCEAVVHHAAIASVPASLEQPVASGSVNCQGTALLFEEARAAQVSRIVLASSSAVYGESDAPLTEDSPTRPLSPYGARKLFAEHLGRSLALAGGPDCVALRYFNVFGPRQRSDSDYAAAIPIFFRRIEEGLSPIVYGNGAQTRDFVFVRDVVEANRRALSAPGRFDGECFNVASGAPISIAELATEILALHDSDLPIEFQDPRPGDIVRSSASIDRITERLDWRPEYTLAQGLRAVVPTV